MPDERFAKVVSCSSEDKEFPAENLLKAESYKKWKCKPGEKQATVILQLEKTVRIHSLDIGNEGSAFVEIFAGRSSSDERYAVLVPTSGFMTPADSREDRNANAVRIFSREKLSKEAADEKWDRLKIICTQPFNKNVGFGLSFVRVHSESGSDGGEKPIRRFLIASADEEDGSRKSEDRSTNFAPGALFSKYKSRDAGPETKIDDKNDKISKASTKVKEIEPKKENVEETKKEAPKLDKFKKEDAEKVEEKTRDKKVEKSKNASRKVPFEKLLDGVFFVLSGYQNPLRAQLRDKAADMGARYRGDWGPGCTHLICAFANTPKYNQVKGKGRIVKHDWILDCHSQRTKIPWKKYSYEKSSDEFSDDEELVANSQDSQETPIKSKIAPSSRCSENDSKKPADTKPKTSSSSAANNKRKLKEDDEEEDPYEASTDYSDLENDDDAGDTDDEIGRVRARKDAKNQPKLQPSVSGKAVAISPKKLKTGSDGLPMLPNFFSGMHFFLFGAFPESERKQLQRFITAFDGALEPYMSKSVTHVLTRSEWDKNFQEAEQEFPDLVFVRPEFVFDCGRSSTLVDLAGYKVQTK